MASICIFGFEMFSGSRAPRALSMVTPRRISKSGIVLMEVFLVGVYQFGDAGEC